MFKILLLAIAFCIGIWFSASPSRSSSSGDGNCPPGEIWVNDYTRANGSVVDGYCRTLPDGDPCNNRNAPSYCDAQNNSPQDIPIIEQDSPIIESDPPEQNSEPEIEKYNVEILRKEFEQIRPQYWKEVSKHKSASEELGQENIDRMAVGKAPIGDDGFPMEVHHKVPLSSGGTNDFGNFKIMTRTQHRLGDNYCKNHPELCD
ncbi:MAG TPA: hypothetical protein PLZ43_04900 [bacterium]|nr:hypothetical protein [bacterium]